MRSRTLSRRIVIVLSGATCAAFLTAPILSAGEHHLSAGVIYSIFAPICHQIRARSFFLSGCPFAVCQRCAAIYLGIFANSILYPVVPFSRFSEVSRRRWVLGAAAPMLLDVALSYSGLWNGTPLTRFSTGFLFGSMIASLLIPAVSELLSEIAWRCARHDPSDMEGGML